MYTIPQECKEIFYFTTFECLLMSQKMEGSFLLFYCWFGWSALAWEPLVFLEFLEKKALTAEWKEVVFWLGAALLTVWKKKKGEARALCVLCHKSSVWMEKRPMALYFRMWINITSVDFVWCYMYNNMIKHLICEIYIFNFGLLAAIQQCLCGMGWDRMHSFFERR